MYCLCNFLRYLAAEARRVIQRFPLTLLCATTLCVAGCQTLHFVGHGSYQAEWVFPLLSASALGLPLTLAAERYRWASAGRWLALTGALGLLAGWYTLAAVRPDVGWGLRLAVLLLGLPFLVTYVLATYWLRRSIYAS